MSMTSPYRNREMSWLDFNDRVLYEAVDAGNPLLECLKFLSIVTGNLEEFFMIRVAVIKKQNLIEMGELSLDKQTAREQLAAVRKRVLEMLERQYMIFKEELCPALRKKGVEILSSIDEIEEMKDVLYPVYRDTFEPLLTPLSVGPTHPFPTLVTGRLYLAVGLNSTPDNQFVEKSELSFVEVPTNAYGRFYKLPDRDAYIPVENIIKLFIPSLYNGYDVTSVSVMRITRDADFSLQEDGAGDLLKEIESTIKRMHRRNVVKLEYDPGTPAGILSTIRDKHQLEDSDLYRIDGILNLKDLFEIYEKCSRDDIKQKPLTPVPSTAFKGRNPFQVIAEKDRLLFHPYHSYDPVVDLIRAASTDPDVLAIKQTLYRTSSRSAIIEALVRAAENGKYVSVIDELKARFDEKRNIEWARRLEDAGAHVTYGVAGLKTHAKALLIVRREPSGIRRYVHLGTGNYNETTARLYTDLSLFTCNEKIAEDVASLFNLLTGFSQAKGWKAATIAPLDLRDRVLSLIRRETENARDGMTAAIRAKMNSLTDRQVIDALFEASRAGVKITLIVRGMCCLQPGLPGVSENIKVHSVVGRFLEHSRVFSFHNGGETEMYLSSADWMMRNLDRRVEILFPVVDKEARAFLDGVLDAQLSDTVNRWKLEADGKYRRAAVKSGKKPYDSFEELYRLVKKMEDDKKSKETVVFQPLRTPDEAES